MTQNNNTNAETGLLQKSSWGLIQKPSLIVILFTACFSFWLVDFWRPRNIYNHQVVFDDYEVFQYYSYLPATFINHSSFEWGSNVTNHTPISPTGKHIPRYNYGLSVLYFPFFVASFFYAEARSPQVGFSAVFANGLHWGGIVYVLLGLFFLRRFLLVYFNEGITAIVLFLSLFGTMLFYYTFAQSEYPECHLFFLYTVFLRYTQKWHTKPSVLNLLVCAISLGVIGLIHVSDMYIVLFFIFWDVHNRAELKRRVVLSKKLHLHLLGVCGVVLVLWIPQMLINLKFAGTLFYNAFPEEKFDFTNAQIYYYLFSYRRGWITYTPLIILPIIGIFLTKTRLPFSRILFVITLLLVLVLYSSWRGQEFISFGARNLCACIAWLSLPMGGLITRVFNAPGTNLKHLLIQLVTVVVVLSCVCLNIVQSIQVTQRRINPEKMTEAIYWETFKSFKHTPNDRGY